MLSTSTILAEWSSTPISFHWYEWQVKRNRVSFVVTLFQDRTMCAWCSSFWGSIDPTNTSEMNEFENRLFICLSPKSVDIRGKGHWIHRYRSCWYYHRIEQRRAVQSFSLTNESDVFPNILSVIFIIIIIIKVIISNADKTERERKEENDRCQ